MHALASMEDSSLRFHTKPWFEVVIIWKDDWGDGNHGVETQWQAGVWLVLLSRLFSPPKACKVKYLYRLFGSIILLFILILHHRHDSSPPTPRQVRIRYRYRYATGNLIVVTRS